MFSVDSSSSAVFTQAMVFEDNSVVSPYHGGAVYAGGMVRGREGRLHLDVVSTLCIWNGLSLLFLGRSSSNCSGHRPGSRSTLYRGSANFPYDAAVMSVQQDIEGLHIVYMGPF